MTRRGWLLFLALGIAWGIPYLFIRIAVTDLDPVVVACGRTAIGALILLPLALHRRTFGPVLRRWPWLLLYTTVEIIAPWVLLGHVETRLPSSTTGLLIAIVPIVAAIIVTLTGQDRLGLRRVLGLAIGLVGVAVLVGLDLRVGDWVALLQLLAVTIGYAIGPILISRQLAGLPTLGVVTASLIVASIAYAPFVIWLRPRHAVPGQAWASVAVLAVVCTATAFLLMFALVAEAGPARMTLITYVNPAIAVLLGALVLHEPLTLGLAIGFPLIIVGSILGTWRSAPHDATAPDRRRRDPAGLDPAPDEHAP